MAAPPDFIAGATLTAQQMNQVGMWKVKTLSVGFGVSSVFFSDVFSADYDNYLITMSGGTGSAAHSSGIQLGASTTGYYSFLNFGDTSSSTPLGAARNNAASAAWLGGCAGAGQQAHLSCLVINPFKAMYTKILNGTYQNSNIYGTSQGEHRVATSYTGFTIIPDAGTLSGGIIRVYGYRN